jgi:uncharacterized protein YlaI
MNQDSITKLIDIIEETEVKVKTETNKDVRMYYKNIIKEMSEALIWSEICPTCGEELKTAKRRDNMGDFQGTPAYEDVEWYVCCKGHKFE